MSVSLFNPLSLSFCFENMNHFAGQSSKIIPNDIVSEVFSHANSTTLGVCSKVCKDWNEKIKPLIEKRKISLYRDNVFSPLDWNHHFGKDCLSQDEIEQAFQLLPPNIDEISFCFQNEERFMDTHIIVWMPKTIEGRNLTIESYSDFLKLKFPNFEQGYHFIFEQVLYLFGSQTIEKSGWIAMTKKVISMTRGKSFDEQEKIVKDLKVYKIPTALEAIVSISAEYFKFKNKIFSHDCTNCQESMNGHQIVVKSGPLSLVVVFDNHLDNYEPDDVGVAAIQKLF